jgi:iron complex outermembrane receptor protein
MSHGSFPPSLRITPLVLALALMAGGSLAAQPMPSLTPTPTPAGGRAAAQPGRGSTPAPVAAEVVVTAPRMEVPLADNPAATTVVNERTLERTASRTIAADEALALVPGVKVDNQADGERVHISIRGQGILTESGIRGIKVLLDGLPLNDPTGFAPDLFDVDWATVDRVEVFRGPASSLYGGGASGGIINITTRDGGPDPVSGDAFATAGSYGFWKGLTEAGGTNGALNYRVSASHNEGDGYRVHTAFRATNLYGKFRLDLSPRTRLHVIVAGTDFFNQNAEGLNLTWLAENRRQANPDALTYNEYQRTRRGTVGVFGVTQLGSASDLTYSLYYRDTRWVESVPSSVDHSTSSSPGAFVQYTTAVSQGSWTHHLSFGTDLDWQTIDEFQRPNLGGAVESPEILSDQTITQSGYGVYALDRIELTPTWGAMLSARRDWIDNELDDHLKAGGIDLSGSRDFSRSTGRVGVTWNPTRDFGMYASWGQGFLPPSTEELSNNPDGFGGFNRHLVPATSNGEEVGARGSLGTTLAYDVAVFHLDTENDFGRYRVASRPLETFYQNAGTSRRWGVETSVAWRPIDRLSVRLAYTWSDFTYGRVQTVDGGSYRGTRLPNAPANQAYLDVEVRPYGNLVLGAGAEMQSRAYVDQSNATWISGYTLVNLRAAYRWTGVARGAEVFVNVSNAGNVEYIAFTEPDPDGNSYQPGPTRQVFAGVRLTVGAI